MIARRFHITAKGNAERCRARVRPCPLKSEHFTSLEEARHAAEAILAGEHASLPSTVSKTAKAGGNSVTIAGLSHPVVDDHELSRFFCTACATRFDYNDPHTALIGGGTARCKCGHRTLLGPKSLSVQKSSLWLLNPECYEAEANVLYHVTTRPNWREGIAENPELQIHLGDLETTQWRVNDMLNIEDAKPPFYLHRVRLRPGPEAKLNVVQDMNEAWHDLADHQDVHVYLNQWENPGSLSVMTSQANLLIEDNPLALSAREAGL